MRRDLEVINTCVDITFSVSDLRVSKRKEKNLTFERMQSEASLNLIHMIDLKMITLWHCDIGAEISLKSANRDQRNGTTF